MHTNPFLRPDSASYAAILADGMVRQFGVRGLSSFSISEVARWMGVTPAAVFQRFRRSRIVELTVREFADRWLAWVAYRDWDSDAVATLPRTDEENHGVRVWALMAELARGEKLAGRGWAESGYSEALVLEFGILSRRLSEALGRPASTEEALVTAAVVHGLRAMLVAPGPLLDASQAEALLAEHVALIRFRGWLT
jgi:AcrR family transcriptional regulator